MFPNRVPMGSNTPSPEPPVHFPFIHSCVSARVPKKEPSYIHVGKNIRSPSMGPHADKRPTYNEVWPGSPRGSLTIFLSLCHCDAAFSTIPSTLASVDQSPVSQHVLWQPPNRGCPPQLFPPPT